MGSRTYSYWLVHPVITAHQAIIARSDTRRREAGDKTPGYPTNKTRQEARSLVSRKRRARGAVTLEKVQISILCNRMA